MGIADYGGDVDFQYLSGIAIPEPLKVISVYCSFPRPLSFVGVNELKYAMTVTAAKTVVSLGSANVDKSQRFYNGDKDIKADDE